MPQLVEGREHRVGEHCQREVLHDDVWRGQILGRYRALRSAVSRRGGGGALGCRGFSGSSGCSCGCCLGLLLLPCLMHGCGESNPFVTLQAGVEGLYGTGQVAGKQLERS